MKSIFTLIATTAVLFGSGANAQYSDGVVKIGVLTDMSSLYSDANGMGTVVAAKLAVEDFDPAAKRMKVEIVFADHQNKADIGSNIANSWIDRDKVDMIVDVPNSAIALAVSEVVRQKNKVFLVSAGGTSDLTGPKCNANTIHWTYDTWNLANGTASAMTKGGSDTWFFLTADYAFGQALERDAAAAVEAHGGKVLGKVRHPLNTNDFSSFLLQAQASGAKVIGLADAGDDTVNAVKQANEFGIIQGGQSLAGLLVSVNNIAALGLPVAKGMVLTENLVLGYDRQQPGVDQKMAGPAPGAPPYHVSSRRVLRGHALSQGSGGREV